MNRIALFATFILFLSGCAQEFEDDPNDGGMDVSFESHYNGLPHNGDNSLHPVVSFPTDSSEEEAFKNGDRAIPLKPGEYQGTSYACFAREPEWEGKWWMQVSLYEDDGRLVDRQRWNIDCISYWISIEENGLMTLHEGNPPWDRPQGIEEDLLILLAIGGVVVVGVVVGSWVLHRWGGRKRRGGREQSGRRQSR